MKYDRNQYTIKRIGSMSGHNAYRVTRADSSVEWPSDDELIQACDEGWDNAEAGRQPRSPFGGSVKPVDQNTVTVNVYTE